MPHIRPIAAADIPAVLDIYAPVVLRTTTSFEIEVPTIADFTNRVAAIQHQAPWLVCEIDGQVTGYAYGSAHRSRAAYQCTRELTVYVHSDYRRRGVATALYTALIGLLKRQGYATALAGITLPNDASVRFHERMGFQLVGIYHRVGYKYGQFLDVGWWEMPISDTPPENIIPISELPPELFKEAIAAALKKIRD